MFNKLFPFIALTVIILNPFNAHSDCLTDPQIKKLWEDAYYNLSHEKNLFYENRLRTPPSYPGYISTTEDHHFTLAHLLDESPADIHVGFGTLINYNFLAARKGNEPDGRINVETAKTLILADQSPEVIVALSSFWRTIWLVSETPQEWLANIASYLTTPDTTLEELFTFIKKRQISQRPAQIDSPLDFLQNIIRCLRHREPDHRESADPRALDALAVKLKPLVSFEKITRFDAEFTLTLLQQEAQNCPSIFKNSKTGNQLAAKLYSVYNPLQRIEKRENAIKKSLEEINFYGEQSSVVFSPEDAQKDRLKTTKEYTDVSFLLNAENFRRARNTFLAGRDYYAISTIEDPRFWKEVGDFARRESKAVTDVYLTCILNAVCPRSKESVFSEIMKLPGSPIENSTFIYESTCDSNSPKITKTVMTRQRP